MKIRSLHFLFIFFLSFHALAGKSAKSFVSPITTQIVSSFCDTTLPSLNTIIYANIATGATSYRFKLITEGTNPEVEQILITSLRSFKLTQFQNFAYSTSYRIQVAVLYQGVWQPYGAECHIITPTPTTMVQAGQCGMVMANISDYIYVDSVPFAIGYKFQITSVANPNEVYTTYSVLRNFKMNALPVTYGSTYSVKAAIKNCDGNYLPYGPSCYVTTPIVFSRVLNDYCGRTLSSLTELIYATIVPSAASYRFRITNTAVPSDIHLITRTIRQFSMSLLSNIYYDTTYRIDVAVKDAQGNFGEYGPFCTINTPSLGNTMIEESQCEMGVTDAVTNMYANPVPGATSYRFKLISTNVNYSQYIERTQNCYNLGMFTGLLPGTTYTIKVAVKVAGVFSNYGKGCDVTTMGGGNTRVAVTEIKSDNEIFSAIAYPNPFSTAFNLDVKLPSNGKVEIHTYDLTGRLLETQANIASDAVSFQIGEKYPPGVYVVVANFGDAIKTLRVIKR